MHSSHLIPHPHCLTLPPLRNPSTLGIPKWSGSTSSQLPRIPLRDSWFSQPYLNNAELPRRLREWRQGPWQTLGNTLPKPLHTINIWELNWIIHPSWLCEVKTLRFPNCRNKGIWWANCPEGPSILRPHNYGRSCKESWLPKREMHPSATSVFSSHLPSWGTFKPKGPRAVAGFIE